MVDRVVTNDNAQVPDIDENLEAVLLYALNRAREQIDAGEEMVPFTALAVGETLFMESHPAESAEECFNQARHTVQGAQGATCYALCYDGYIDTSAGQQDALIAEGGLPGQLEGHAVGIVYTESGDDITFSDEVIYVGNAPNFMMGLSTEPFDHSEFEDEAGEHDEDERDERDERDEDDDREDDDREDDRERDEDDEDDDRDDD